MPMTSGVTMLRYIAAHVKYAAGNTQNFLFGECASLKVRTSPCYQNPLAKKARLIAAMTTNSRRGVLWITLRKESNIPQITGSSRDGKATAARLSSQSENTPPSRPPIKPAMAGNTTTKPTFVNRHAFARTDRSGTSVRKKSSDRGNAELPGCKHRSSSG